MLLKGINSRDAYPQPGAAGEEYIRLVSLRSLRKANLLQTSAGRYLTLFILAPAI